MTALSFGIATPPQQVGYDDLLRVWLEADEVPAIEHAWLFDHLLPIAGDRTGPILEGWTLLAALAAQTRRLRLGLLVTSNRIRPPAVLAKIAATVDIVSGGRLEFGIGAGSRPSLDWARHEYDANGLPYADYGDSVAALDEALTVIERLWTADLPFDFDGEHVHLRGAIGNPKPVQRPRPPILVGGRSGPTLRVVAKHADVWNLAGVDAADLRARGALLDRYCREIGRDPAGVVRSTTVRVDYGDAAATRAAVAEVIGAGCTHVVLSLPAPYPEGVAAWAAREVIEPSRALGTTPDAGRSPRRG